ncbi:hypothetical protein [Pengzhenrongella frigida]|uniref:Bacterial spore germination immunoglobulin-like domain-containing protein n=1 Tax=Pengzhenrongella frigida TaxID=1259133 RepID=A0A4Q5MZN3_9MICO|nr:hypothetical protein [Cellulomonas sp. HLT2-17]RYV51199.1 hypothetical protein EUA98_09925 [Cellulomonas sp. HLT2-17]
MRTAPRRLGASTLSRLVSLALVVAGLSACAGTGTAVLDHPGRTDAAAQAASVAGLEPQPEGAPAGSVEVGVPAGTVSVDDGPFTDRLRITELRLSDSAVTGSLAVTSDVSEVLNLEVRVDFYGAAGDLLGSDRQVFTARDTEPFHSTAGVVGLPITVPAPVPGSHSAVVSIPVLVNE